MNKKGGNFFSLNEKIKFLNNKQKTDEKKTNTNDVEEADVSYKDFLKFKMESLNVRPKGINCFGILAIFEWSDIELCSGCLSAIKGVVDGFRILDSEFVTSIDCRGDQEMLRKALKQEVERNKSENIPNNLLNTEIVWDSSSEWKHAYPMVDFFKMNDINVMPINREKEMVADKFEDHGFKKVYQKVQVILEQNPDSKFLRELETIRDTMINTTSKNIQSTKLNSKINSCKFTKKESNTLYKKAIRDILKSQFEESKAYNKLSTINKTTDDVHLQRTAFSNSETKKISNNISHKSSAISQIKYNIHQRDNESSDSSCSKQRNLIKKYEIYSVNKPRDMDCNDKIGSEEDDGIENEKSRLDICSDYNVKASERKIISDERINKYLGDLEESQEESSLYSSNILSDIDRSLDDSLSNNYDQSDHVTKINSHQKIGNFKQKYTKDNRDFYANKKYQLYKTEICRSHSEAGYCKYGSNCQFAHDSTELRQVSRHPKYKTETCKTFWKDGSCPYGRRCCFIHVNGTADQESKFDNHLKNQSFYFSEYHISDSESSAEVYNKLRFNENLSSLIENAKYDTSKSSQSILIKQDNEILKDINVTSIQIKNKEEDSSNLEIKNNNFVLDDAFKGSKNSISMSGNEDFNLYKSSLDLKNSYAKTEFKNQRSIFTNDSHQNRNVRDTFNSNASLLSSQDTKNEYSISSIIIKKDSEENIQEVETKNKLTVKKVIAEISNLSKLTKKSFNYSDSNMPKESTSALFIGGNLKTAKLLEKEHISYDWPEDLTNNEDVTCITDYSDVTVSNDHKSLKATDDYIKSGLFSFYMNDNQDKINVQKFKRLCGAHTLNKKATYNNLHLKIYNYLLKNTSKRPEVSKGEKSLNEYVSNIYGNSNHFFSKFWNSNEANVWLESKYGLYYINLNKKNGKTNSLSSLRMLHCNGN